MTTVGGWQGWGGDVLWLSLAPCLIHSADQSLWHIFIGGNVCKVHTESCNSFITFCAVVHCNKNAQLSQNPWIHLPAHQGVSACHLGIADLGNKQFIEVMQTRAGKVIMSSALPLHVDRIHQHKVTPCLCVISFTSLLEKAQTWCRGSFQKGTGVP